MIGVVSLRKWGYRRVQRKDQEKDRAQRHKGRIKHFRLITRFWVRRSQRCLENVGEVDENVGKS